MGFVPNNGFKFSNFWWVLPILTVLLTPDSQALTRCKDVDQIIKGDVHQRVSYVTLKGVHYVVVPAGAVLIRPRAKSHSSLVDPEPHQIVFPEVLYAPPQMENRQVSKAWIRKLIRDSNLCNGCTIQILEESAKGAMTEVFKVRISHSDISADYVVKVFSPSRPYFNTHVPNTTPFVEIAKMVQRQRALYDYIRARKDRWEKQLHRTLDFDPIPFRTEAEFLYHGVFIQSAIRIVPVNDSGKHIERDLMSFCNEHNDPLAEVIHQRYGYLAPVTDSGLGIGIDHGNGRNYGFYPGSTDRIFLFDW